jgi:hypothetical protein
MLFSRKKRLFREHFRLELERQPGDVRRRSNDNHFIVRLQGGFPGEGLGTISPARRIASMEIPVFPADTDLPGPRTGNR